VVAAGWCFTIRIRSFCATAGCAVVLVIMGHILSICANHGGCDEVGGENVGPLKVLDETKQLNDQPPIGDRSRAAVMAPSGCPADEQRLEAQEVAAENGPRGGRNVMIATCRKEAGARSASLPSG
jgi:hypothetical protein